MREAKSSIVSRGDLKSAYKRVETNRAFYDRTKAGSRAEKTAEGLLERSKSAYNKKAKAYVAQGGDLMRVNRGKKFSS